MAGGIDEEITVEPLNKHYCSDCIVYLAVYGFRMNLQVAALCTLLLFHSLLFTLTMSHLHKNIVEYA